MPQPPASGWWERWWVAPRPGTGSARWSAWPCRWGCWACSPASSWVLHLSTLALDGSSARASRHTRGQPDPLRGSGAARARAAGLPRWPTGRCSATRSPLAPGSPSGSSSSPPTAESPLRSRAGERRGRLGVTAASRRSGASGSSPSAVLLVGLLGEREDGLAAALLAALLFTVQMRIAVSRARPGKACVMSRLASLSTKAKVFLALGLYLGITSRPDPDPRERGQERGVPAAERVLPRPLDRRSTSRASTSRSTRPSSTCSSRAVADDRDDDLHREPDAARAEQDPDGGRARLRPDAQQHHRRQPRRGHEDGEPLVPVASRASSSSSGSRT